MPLLLPPFLLPRIKLSIGAIFVFGEMHTRGRQYLYNNVASHSYSCHNPFYINKLLGQVFYKKTSWGSWSTDCSLYNSLSINHRLTLKCLHKNQGLYLRCLFIMIKCFKISYVLGIDRSLLIFFCVWYEPSSLSMPYTCI